MLKVSVIALTAFIVGAVCGSLLTPAAAQNDSLAQIALVLSRIANGNCNNAKIC